MEETGEHVRRRMAGGVSRQVHGISAVSPCGGAVAHGESRDAEVGEPGGDGVALLVPDELAVAAAGEDDDGGPGLAAGAGPGGERGASGFRREGVRLRGIWRDAGGFQAVGLSCRGRCPGLEGVSSSEGARICPEPAEKLWGPACSPEGNEVWHLVSVAPLCQRRPFWPQANHEALHGPVQRGAVGSVCVRISSQTAPGAGHSRSAAVLGCRLAKRARRVAFSYGGNAHLQKCPEDERRSPGSGSFALDIHHQCQWHSWCLDFVGGSWRL